MDKPFLYDQDFYGWTQQQAKALKQRLVMELDWQHLQEEIQALGRQEYRELVSRLSVLLGHLLKRESIWRYEKLTYHYGFFQSIALIYLMLRSQTIFCAILVKTGKDNSCNFPYDHLLFGDTLYLSILNRD